MVADNLLNSLSNLSLWVFDEMPFVEDAVVPTDRSEDIAVITADII